MKRNPSRYRLTVISTVEDTMGLGVDQLRQRAYEGALLLPARMADRTPNPVVVAVRLLPAFSAMTSPAKREHLLVHGLLDLVTAAGDFATHTDAALAGYHRGGHGPGADHVHDDEPRVRTIDARTGEPHDGVLRTRTGRVITAEELDRWAAQAVESEAEVLVGVTRTPLADKLALDEITAILREPDWSPDTLNRIRDEVEASGRSTVEEEASDG